ncbi:MAG TPA: hypothetical protein VH142_05675 [Polyangiaceae bacterium]|jgi:hypothetical protein|nr:hypothetical protein [Polyangiaceae bacterium]
MAEPDAITTIIETLKETDEQPRQQILEIVQALGDAGALGVLEEARRVQQEGGLDVRDGTRRRTLGGVFFNLAKSKLPRSERNRIFRARPPKADGDAETPEDAVTPVPAAAPAPAAAPVATMRQRVAEAPAEDRRRRVVELPSGSPRPHGAGPAPSPALGGRRRMVEVEVIRHPGLKPITEPIVRSGPAAVSRPAEREAAPPPPPQQELRPLRRIVTVSAPRDESPANSDEAAERVRVAIKKLAPDAQRKLLASLFVEFGGVIPTKREVAPPAPPPPPPKAPESKPKIEERGLGEGGRERVLVAVTEALGLTPGDLARALYGDDTAGTRAKARAVLERSRKRDG